MPGEEHATTGTARSTLESIEEVAAVEEQALRERTLGERISDALVRFMGRLSFVAAHLALFVLWFLINSGAVPGVRPFDPFPFGILTLIVSAEGVLFTLLVLISQNRMARQADLRAHITLQLGLLEKKRTTRALDILEGLRERLGLPAPDEAHADLVKPADVPTLARELKERLPDE
jgi:uncharacterized membrane protein